MGVHRTIVLQGEEARYHEERNAGAAGIMPGDCCIINADNEAVDQYFAGGQHPVLVAKEDYLQGKTIDQAYADEDPVFLHRAMPGHKVNLRLAASQTITKDELLEYDGTGKVRVLAAGTAKFQAAEDVTTGGAETKRIAAYVI
jgi:hypothetical protein